MGYFLPFCPPNSPKNQNFEKMKKCLELSSFYTCVPKIMIRWWPDPQICCATWDTLATDGQTDRWKKWDIEMGAPPKNVYDLIYWNTYKNLHKIYIQKHVYQLTCNLKIQNSHFFLCFSILNFKTLILSLEVGMKLKALHNKSNTKYCVVEIHQWWKLWNYLTLLLRKSAFGFKID